MSPTSLQSSNDGLTVAAPTPCTRTNSSAPSGVITGVLITDQRLPLAAKCVSLVQVERVALYRHRSFNASSSVLVNARTGSEATAVISSTDVKVGEKTARVFLGESIVCVTPLARLRRKEEPSDQTRSPREDHAGWVASPDCGRFTMPSVVAITRTSGPRRSSMNAVPIPVLVAT